MLRDEFRQKWPRLFKAITLIGADNGMTLKREMAIFDLNEMERIASLLSDENLDVVCCGEQEESETLLQIIGGEVLNDFLNEVFEGDLNAVFYRD